MDPMTIMLAVALIKLVIEYGPQILAAIQPLLA